MPPQPPKQDVFPITTKPGIKRDGTEFEGNFYLDGQWCRFQRGLPRKMGGYQQITDALAGPVRGCFVSSANDAIDVYAGSAEVLEKLTIFPDGSVSGLIDRTPSGFATSDLNVWQFDSMFDAGGSGSVLIAHAGQNLASIASDVDTPVYYGDIYGTAALTSTGQSVSGGACVLGQYLFVYGNDGYLAWSNVNEPTNFATGDAGSARVTAEKIVYGAHSRAGGTTAPSGLFWSLDCLLRVSYTGGDSVFNVDTVAREMSILSSSAVIEYDGLFFWPAVDRFLVYNGVVREVPNQMNLNWFFDNLNFSQRQKVWGTKVPRYGEIWWFYPTMNQAECGRAVIYNVRESTWYDTSIARSCGYFSQVFRNPLWFGVDPTAADTYRLWVHETGVDQVIENQAQAIQSYFTTCDLSWCASGPGESWIGVDRWTRIDRIEPDFVQTGQMTATILGKKYAQSTETQETVYYFDPTTEKFDINQQRRQMRIKFESNVAGGNYQMGQPLLHLSIGSARQ